MKIVVSCTEAQKQELTAAKMLPEAEIIFLAQSNELVHHKADAFLDLQFEHTGDRIRQLQTLLPNTIIINSIENTLAETGASFIRINAWPTFLGSSLLEGSCLDNEKKRQAESVLSIFHKQIEWLPDEPGFVTPRIISMIINEAFFALSEGISTREEMDTAMKLGTSYPYGPFEWAQKIGLKNIVSLLTALSQQRGRYMPSALLLEESRKA